MGYKLTAQWLTSNKNKKKSQQNFTFTKFCRSMKLAPVKNRWIYNYEKLTTNEKKRTKRFYSN